MDVTLGIDIGGTNTKLGLVTRKGDCIVSTRIDTHAWEPIDIFFSHLFVAIEQLKVEAGPEVKVIAIGVGAPNANYYSGYIEDAPNLGWGPKIPLVKLIQDKLDLPMWITNDANAAAVGEMKFGVARGMKNFVVITLGTGLGSGFIVDGKLVYGQDGFAGELGHITVIPNGRDHTTGRKGSLEPYVSATGIKRTIFELMANRVDNSPLRKIPFEDLEAKDIFEAAMKEDALALEAFGFTGNLLGRVLADVIISFDPEAVILFGGLANAGEVLLKPTHEAMQSHLPPFLQNSCKLLVSDLKGDNTAILGSSAIAWEEMERRA